MSTHPEMDDIREAFAELWKDREYHRPQGTLEIVGASFLANGPTLFGEVNEEYVARELAWYESESLAVADIPGGPPKIWQNVASTNGWINSNYGFLVHSPQNGSQYDHVVASLRKYPMGRQATAVYTRPSIHSDWNKDGMHDFICTNAVNYYIREGAVHAVVQMRSNDAVFGYRNDYAWQKHVLEEIAEDVGGVLAGDIIWQAGSLHIYERHWHLVETFAETGEWDIPVTRG